ncbi:MAG: hypothetical protein AAF824_01205 [Bacteroidota bacterium]
MLVIGLIYFGKRAFHFLSVTEKVDSEVVIVEGWLPWYALKQVRDKYREGKIKKIICVGSLKSDLKANVNNSGKLVWDLSDNPVIVNNLKDNMLNVKASGERMGAEFSSFSVLVNGHKIGRSLTSEQEESYEFNLPADVHKINYVEVSYGERKETLTEEGNVHVSFLSLGNDEIIPKVLKCIYEEENNTKIEDIPSSVAYNAAFDLKRLKVPDSALVTIPAPYVKRFRTYVSALAAEAWLDSTDNRPDKIDIYSLGAHSRRTYEVYNKLIGDKVNLGIVSVKVIPITDAQRSDPYWYKKQKILRGWTEALKYLTTKFTMMWTDEDDFKIYLDSTHKRVI